MSSIDNINEDNEEIVLLATALSDVEVLLFEGILRENDIPYLKKSKDSGQVMGFIMGFSLYGCDFYVESSRFEEAASLLEAYTTEIDTNEAEDE
ncbi:MAG: hypothetical protein A2Y15_01195 [Clostridiales bacterium GWF2_36_10]|nr:MAG: hypothetical protein A2Y15_01195 [Clostridiales bacterium GWF2_36_10]HAN22018.1 DUF2007 domain-containing protein [Clostridiales bacterium]